MTYKCSDAVISLGGGGGGGAVIYLDGWISRQIFALSFWWHNLNAMAFVHGKDSSE